MSRSYSDYKNSGFRWIGRIPASWDLRKVKFGDYVEMGQSPSSDDYNSEGVGPPFLQGNADFTSLHPEPQVWCATANKIAEDGDVLVSVRAPVGAVNIADMKYGIGRGLCAVRPKQSNPKYLYYIFSALEDELNSLGTGSTYTAISTDDLKNVYLPQPPLPEQRTIAAYLDLKTAQIDTLIAKKQRLIDLLQEQRTAVINRAITKGLDPDTPMQDSGIEWLGEVPAHWDTGKLRHVAQFYGGGTPSKSNDEYWQGDIPWVSPKDMKTDWVSDTEDHVTEEAIEESSTKLVEKGAVLLVVRSGILRHSLPVAINTRTVTLNQDMKAIVPEGSLMPDYLRFYIIGNKSNLLQEWRKQGATVESIEHQFLAEHRMPLPPVEEQSAIVNFLNNRCQEIERTVDKERKTIVLLQELRTSLVSEVVTGKIDVRDEVSERAEVAV